MYHIVNEVELRKQAREREKLEKLKKEGKKTEEVNEGKEKKKKEVTICKTDTDVQKRKLDKLMNDPTKEAYIPQPRKEWKPRDAPEFVRHVMGSSAGAGSGEFHVYRGIRKRERKRVEYMEKKSLKIELDDEFHSKVESNKQKAEELTAKKRAKRQRKKQKKLQVKKMKNSKDQDNSKNEKSSEEDETNQEEEEEEEEEPHFHIGGK